MLDEGEETNACGLAGLKLIKDFLEYLMTMSMGLLSTSWSQVGTLQLVCKRSQRLITIYIFRANHDEVDTEATASLW